MSDFERMDALAQDVLKLCRNTLLVNLRFLDRALSMFDYVSCPGGIVSGTDISMGGGLATDRENIYYEPQWVLQRYRNEKEAIVRDYLHMVFHCVFHHAFVSTLVDIPRWNLACDIAVESVIEDLNIRCTRAKRSDAQRTIVASLRNEIKQMSAEKIYAYLREKQMPDSELVNMQRCFHADSHDIWYLRTLALSVQRNSSAGSNRDGRGAESAGMPADRASGLKEEWESIARRMQTDIDTFSKLQGDRAGSMIQNLRTVTRERYDYTDFLRRFSVLGEAMKINDDEFDYIFYTYGMQMYKKMPLIEPLEYKEVKRIREFVIAIDTSGSVEGDTVQRFLNKTYNILKQQESFFTKINLHIIQCDAEIQEDYRITSQDEFDEYLKTMQIRGLGGTDFRPVFEYVEQLRKNKEFTNLRGLIYFTDGFGTFPECQPDYHAAFVFIDDEYNNFEVPVWAIKLILQRNEM